MEGMTVHRAGLQQEHANVRILRQARGDDTAGGARPDDDEIMGRHAVGHPGATPLPSAARRRRCQAPLVHNRSIFRAWIRQPRPRTRQTTVAV